VSGSVKSATRKRDRRASRHAHRQIGEYASPGNAEQLIREHGGKLVERPEDSEVIIVSDESSDPKSIRTSRELFDEDLRARVAAGDVEVLGETALWSQLGLVDFRAGR